MKKSFVFCALFFIVFFSNSCKKEISEVNQDKIYSTYTVAILDDGPVKTTVASAKFYQDPSKRYALLLDEGLVSFNGTELRNDTNTIIYPVLFVWADADIAKTRYHEAFPGESQRGEFEFTNAWGHTFNNEVRFINEVNAPDSSYTVKIGETLTIPWQGSSLKEGESVCVEGYTLSSSFEEERCQNTFNSNSISIVARDTIFLQDSFYLAPPKTLFVRLVRKIEDDVTQSSNGGTIERRYCSQLFKINTIH